MSLAPWTSAAEGGGILFTASPRRGEEEHAPKGEERRGVAVPPRSDESAGQIPINLIYHLYNCLINLNSHGRLLFQPIFEHDRTLILLIWRSAHLAPPNERWNAVYILVGARCPDPYSSKWNGARCSEPFHLLSWDDRCFGVICCQLPTERLPQHRLRQPLAPPDRRHNLLIECIRTLK